MKTILILQSLLIIGGAFYIYTLGQTPSPAVPQTTADNVRVVTPTPMVKVDTATTTPAYLEAAEIIELQDNHDQGMEWPTLENEADLEPR